MVFFVKLYNRCANTLFLLDLSLVGMRMLPYCFLPAFDPVSHTPGGNRTKSLILAIWRRLPMQSQNCRAKIDLDRRKRRLRQHTNWIFQESSTTAGNTPCCSHSLQCGENVNKHGELGVEVEVWFGAITTFKNYGWGDRGTMDVYLFTRWMPHLGNPKFT